MPEQEAKEPDADEEDAEEAEDDGIQPGEVDEIDEQAIKELAGAAAGDDEDDEDEDEDPAAELDTGGDAGTNPEMAIERLKSSIEMLKEQNSNTGDRLQTVSGNVGEIRQMVHEQESKFQDLQVDVEKLQDDVEDIEPRKIAKRLEEIRADIDANEASIQKLEERLDRVNEIASDAQETLNQLGSMENLIELNKEFEQKLDEIKEAERYIERLAQKSEKINIRINKKMDEYSTYKARVDALQEKVDDMFRKLDETSIEVEDAVKTDELEQTRNRVKELEEQIEEFKEVAPLEEMSLPQPIVELREERRDIEEFLDELEQQYEDGTIDPAEYEKLKERNEEKLEDINDQLVQEWQNLEEAADADVQEDLGTGGPETGADDAEAEEGGDAADEEEAADASGADDYDAIVDQSIDDVKAAVEDRNLDIDKVIAAEQAGEDRDTLIDWLESKQAGDDAADEEDEDEEIDYDELADQDADAVKAAVEEKNLDLTALLKAERNGQNRGELLEWIEGKLTEQG